jgi:hypothetical protein
LDVKCDKMSPVKRETSPEKGNVEYVWKKI